MKIDPKIAAQIRLISRYLLIFVFSILVGWFLLKPSKNKQEEACVNIYDWYGMLPREVIQQFEKETGIRVRYDLYDNNEILEAKLLASNSGYDIVFPSASPYVARQIAVGIYQPLNKSLLTNLNQLDPFIEMQMRLVDSELKYALPYYWGTLGIAFDVDKMNALLPGVPQDSYDLLFNPENLKKLAPHGISFLEEGVDVIPLIQNYLGKSRDSVIESDLEEACHHLLKLRPYIKRFTSGRFINDLVMGDVCIAQAWSGEAQQAEEEAKEVGRNIKYVIPKEGTTLWIDCVAIPVGAPHPKNAHLFINFLLRPEVSAKITNHTNIPTAVHESYKLVDARIRANPSVFPSKEVMKKLYLDKPQTDEKSMNYDRLRTRAWSKVRLNR